MASYLCKSISKVVPQQGSTASDLWERMQGQAQLIALAPGALEHRRQHLKGAADAPLEPPRPQPKRLYRLRKGSHLHLQDLPSAVMCIGSPDRLHPKILGGLVSSKANQRPHAGMRFMLCHSLRPLAGPMMQRSR